MAVTHKLHGTLQMEKQILSVNPEEFCAEAVGVFIEKGIRREIPFALPDPIAKRQFPIYLKDAGLCADRDSRDTLLKFCHTDKVGFRLFVGSMFILSSLVGNGNMTAITLVDVLHHATENHAVGRGVF